MIVLPNKCAPGKGGIPSLLHAERAWPALPEQYLQLFIEADSLKVFGLTPKPKKFHEYRVQRCFNCLQTVDFDCGKL